MLNAAAGAFASLIACSVLSLGCVVLEDDPALPQSQDRPREAAAPTPPSQQDLYKEPSGELDQRIAREKITESEPPPLPQRVVLPMPPKHAISREPREVPISEESWRRAREALRKALDFLRAQQDAQGAWMRGARIAPTDQPDRPSPVALAVTALALKAFAQADAQALENPTLRKALDYLMRAQNPDGSFDQSSLANYVNASVLSALATVGDHHDDPALINSVQVLAQRLQANQWDQSEGVRARQDWFGGAGYGNNQRPDLSNTQMMMDAMYDAGLSPDEPAFQKALAFASRTQNLKATNKSAWAGDDGGFIYTPANGGESMASEAAGEGRRGEKLVEAGQPRSLRSYGSMTYAGFKSMLYAGLSPDDVRVRAAFDWVRNHWTFDENPGLGQQGLYYYYHTMARALHIAQQHEITDVAGVKHNWREELIDAIGKRQREDGSWINDADRWMEGDPVLVTVYCVLALEEALKPVTP